MRPDFESMSIEELEDFLEQHENVAEASLDQELEDFAQSVKDDGCVLFPSETFHVLTKKDDGQVVVLESSEERDVFALSVNAIEFNYLEDYQALIAQRSFEFSPSELRVFSLGLANAVSTFSDQPATDSE